MDPCLVFVEKEPIAVIEMSSKLSVKHVRLVLIKGLMPLGRSSLIIAGGPKLSDADCFRKAREIRPPWGAKHVHA